MPVKLCFLESYRANVELKLIETTQNFKRIFLISSLASFTRPCNSTWIIITIIYYSTQIIITVIYYSKYNEIFLEFKAMSSNIQQDTVGLRLSSHATGYDSLSLSGLGVQLSLILLLFHLNILATPNKKLWNKKARTVLKWWVAQSPLLIQNSYPHLNISHTKQQIMKWKCKNSLEVMSFPVTSSYTK